MLRRFSRLIVSAAILTGCLTAATSMPGASAAGTNLFASVGLAGNLVSGGGVSSVTHLGSGRYDLTFPASVKSCAYLATVGDPGNALVFNPNGVYTGSGPNANTVYIETKNPGGGLSSGIPFHVAVICPNAANVHAIVVGPG